MSERSGLLTQILAILLILSLLGNVYLVLFPPNGDATVAELQETTNSLERQVAYLNSQVAQDNITIRSYASQLETYRQMVTGLQGQVPSSSSSLLGFATIQGPAVRQGIDPQSGQTVNEGTMINISVEIRPGEGRALVHTVPLMGIVFQDAANTAVYVAQNLTGKSLAGSDVIFSVEAQDQIPAIDGPSAGALMTSLVIAALTDQTPRQDITLTGTIDPHGNVGAIGGVVEKAQAAKAAGKTEILLPRENAQLVQYTETVRRFGRFSYVQQVPTVIDAKEYIENNVGIHVVYVDTMRDVMAELGLHP
jgi:predicted S18 family serine protease